MEKFYKTCITCNARLTSDEKAIYMKLVNRTASEFLCLDCLSKKLGCERAALEICIVGIPELLCNLSGGTNGFL